MKLCPECGCRLVWAEKDGRERLLCPSNGCGFVHWDNPTPVLAAVVEIDGKVVLTRNKGWPEKWFGVVAGFLERGETPEAGMLREVREELGIQGEIAGFVGYYSFLERNQLILMFHVTASGPVVPGEELAEVKLVRPQDLRPWPVGTGPGLRDWLERQGYAQPAAHAGA
jgi:NAD+ diphosphatase